jgi:regulator of replication initiation timing
MGILDNAKQVAKAVEEIHNLELYQRVLGLHSDIIELVEENNRLRAENAELRSKKTFKVDSVLTATGERTSIICTKRTVRERTDHFVLPAGTLIENS